VGAVVSLAIRVVFGCGGETDGEEERAVQQREEDPRVVRRGQDHRGAAGDLSGDARGDRLVAPVVSSATRGVPEIASGESAVAGHRAAAYRS